MGSFEVHAMPFSYRYLYDIQSDSIAKGDRLSLRQNTQEHCCTMAGYDLTRDNLRELEYGTIDFLISQSCSDQVSIGLQTLIDQLCFNKSPDDQIKHMPVELFSKSKIVSFTE
ncbi:MAG: hypothetical protein HQL32_12815 [Planctomycetes bacterium]|nr:hypothetical protein [Planctomycetota bacterium]